MGCFDELFGLLTGYGSSKVIVAYISLVAAAVQIISYFFILLPHGKREA